ncbi:MAG: AAA family ATPase [Candidatus Dormibacteria bacterium]
MVKQLAERMPARRLCGDEQMALLGISLRDERVRETLEVAYWRQAQELLRQGRHLTLESRFWSRSDRDQKRNGARELRATVELVFLDVPKEELWIRLELRNQRAERGVARIRSDQLAHWTGLFQPPTPAELQLFDQSDLGSASPLAEPLQPLPE